MRQSSSSIVFTITIHLVDIYCMLIDLPDDLVGSYTWLTYHFMSMYPFIPLPHILKFYSSTLFLSYSWLMMMIIVMMMMMIIAIMMMIIVMMIEIRIAIMTIIGHVYDIDYDWLYYLHSSLLRVSSRSSSSWSISYKQLLYEQNEKKLQMMMMSGELTSWHRHGLVVEARLIASYEESRSMSWREGWGWCCYDFVLLLTFVTYIFPAFKHHLQHQHPSLSYHISTSTTIIIIIIIIIITFIIISITIININIIITNHHLSFTLIIRLSIWVVPQRI